MADLDRQRHVTDRSHRGILGVAEQSFHELASYANRLLTHVLTALADLPDEARERHLCRLSRAQRHVALTVWPLLDPLMRSFAEYADPPNDDPADRSYLESAVDLINGTRSHAGYAFRTAWTLLLTLIAHEDLKAFVPDVFSAMRTLPERDTLCLMPAILSNWPNATERYRLAAGQPVGALAQSLEQPLLADMAHGLIDSTHDQMEKLTLAVAGIDVLTETVTDRSATPAREALKVLWQTYFQSSDIFEKEVTPHMLEGTITTVFGHGCQLALPRVPIARLEDSSSGTIALVVNQQFPVRMQGSALGNFIDLRLLTAVEKDLARPVK